MYILQWIISLQIYTNDKKLSSAPVAVMCATKPRSSRALRRSLWLRWKQPPRSRSGRILHRILCNRSLLSVIIIVREREIRKLEFNSLVALAKVTNPILILDRWLKTAFRISYLWKTSPKLTSRHIEGGGVAILKHLFWDYEQYKYKICCFSQPSTTS